jgi:bifunctional pyridoxal-dependent enzyme with beta-cystathionase and maltose regulon repressor activities
VKTAQQGSAKWVANTQASAPQWVAGIQNTTVDVMAKAVQQIPAAIAGYTASLSSGAYAKAVQASGGTSNWKTKSEAKQGNFAVGVAAGADAQANALGKIMTAMGPIVSGLPARGPAGSPQNYARSASVGQALHARKGDFKG